MPTIHNPILPGFNPDPSILRVGEDYYIATSTFEWFPGVALYHSKDLANWRPIGHALTRRSQLDLLGVTDSSGIWAPSLSYANGLFHLIYTIVRTRASNFKDVHNFLVTATDIAGPWSKPIFLNSSGFDPSLFHEDDGRQWLANMVWDYRPGRNKFAGILLQQYSPKEQKLIGPVTKILQKSILSEGPNLYKKNAWYYLMLAEGGTGWNHGIAMARSRSITGPYELDPKPLVMTSRKNGSLPLQKAGHGELVQTPGGEWYLVHLASRPIFPGSALRARARDVFAKGRMVARRLVATCRRAGPTRKWTFPGRQTSPPHPWPIEPTRDDFKAKQLSLCWQSLRVPIEANWLSLNDRPGWLRLRGRESQHSLFEQSLLARRLKSVNSVVETAMQFGPQNFMQSAGLVLWYDTRNHFYLRLTCDDTGRRVLILTITDDGTYSELPLAVDVSGVATVHLRAALDDEKTQFAFSGDGQDWQPAGPPLDTFKLSDDYGSGMKFTGTMVGICCQDLAGTRRAADFDYFEMQTR